MSMATSSRIHLLLRYYIMQQVNEKTCRTCEHIDAYLVDEITTDLLLFPSIPHLQPQLHGGSHFRKSLSGDYGVRQY